MLTIQTPICQAVTNRFAPLIRECKPERTDDKCKAHGGTGFRSECWICNMERPELPQVI